MDFTWIDISVPLRNGMPCWPGDPEFRLERVLAIERGDSINLSAASLCMHTGTHVDAPLHYLAGGASIDQMPSDAAIGPAKVVEYHGTADLPDAGERVLLKGAGRTLASEDAQLLVDRHVRCVGIDALSIGSDEAHRILLSAGVWIIEGLDLAAIASGDYELVCLPLRVPGAEGAPARALLRVPPVAPNADVGH